jgi:hypothetical protein
MYNFSIPLFVRRLLPPFLRKDKQSAWIETLLKPVEWLLAAFNAFRIEKTIEAQYTSQTLSLQDWLNRKFDPTQKRILILHASALDEFDYFASEGQNPDFDYLASEGQPYGYLYFAGEKTGGFAENFRVAIPADLASLTDQIRAAVLRYKFAGITYAVVTS